MLHNCHGCWRLLTDPYITDGHAEIAGITGIGEDLCAEAADHSDGSLGEGGSGKCQPVE